MALEAPLGGDDWFGISAEALPVALVSAWAARPDCGASVAFCGMVRDHAEGRPDVSELHYEAFEEEVVPRLEAIGRDVRARWPDIGRIALLHRTGTLGVGEVSVVVAVCSPHRAEAFEAGLFAIDTLKATVPIWKRETWAGGEDWSACSHPVAEVESASGGRP